MSNQDRAEGVPLDDLIAEWSRDPEFAREMANARDRLAARRKAPQAPGADTPGGRGDDRLAEILHRLDSWSQAYLEDVFTPTTHDEIQAVAAAFPGMVDRISASMGRHMVKHMREMADVIRAHPAESSGGDAVDADTRRLDWMHDQLREVDLYNMLYPNYSIGRRNLREAIDAAIASGGEQ